MNHKSKQQRIGFVLASIHTGTALNLWPHLVSQANRKGGAFYIFPGGMLDSQKESEYLRNSIYKLANSQNLDGLISWGSTIGGAISMEELNGFHESLSPMPFVTIGHKIQGSSCVDFDAYNGMKELVHHFIKKHGSRKIAFLRGPENHVSAQERYKAFLDALKEENILFEGYENLISEPVLWTEGEKAIVQLYEKRNLVPGQDFDTLIGSSDMMLFAAVLYLQKYGYKIPEDLRIASFNDSAESRIFSTPFTTVHLPYEELARVSFTKMQETLEDITTRAIYKKIAGKLIVRESCGCSRSLVTFTEDVFHARLDNIEQAKKDICAKITEVLSLSSKAANSYVEPLIDSLIEQDSKKFFSLFENFLTKFFNKEGDVRFVFEAITLLQESGLIVSSYFTKIIKSVYNMVLQVHTSCITFKRYEIERRYSVLNSLKCDLLSAHNRKELINILFEQLPKIGLHTVSIVLYENDEFYRYVGGFSRDSGGSLVYLESQSELFSAGRLVPKELEKDYLSGAFLVQPLFIENQPLGYIITNIAFFDGSVYEDLRSAVSNSLHGIFLFEQTLASKQIAERAEHAKTEFFSNIGADLSDPLIDIVQKLESIENLVEDGKFDKDILVEQILFVKSQVNAQLEKTNMLVDLTLSKVDDLAVEKRLFHLNEIIPDVFGFPLLYGDSDRLKKAFDIIREEYSGDLRCSLENDGVHIVFTSNRNPVDSWAKPSMLLAEKLVLLQFGELIAEKDYCHVVLPYPNLAGLAPCKNAKIPERIISFTENLFEISDMHLPVVQKNTGNYNEFINLDKNSTSIIAWNFDKATMKDIVNVYAMRNHSELFRAPFMCFSEKVSATTLLEMLEKAIRAKREEPVLFINAMVTRYEGWANSDNVISINSMADFDSVITQVLPSLIVFEKIDIDAIKAIRRRPDTVLVPILILPKTFLPSEESEEVCSLPRLLVCNRGVASSSQFAKRIREIISGGEILPPHTGALVKKAIIYLNEHVSSQIVRWKLADSVHVSEDYLTRIFRKELGLSLWEYLNRYRISLATDLLLNTNGTIYEIAEQTGFQDQAYFCRVFKKIHGVPPGKIRNKTQRRSE
ncbi:MAG: substrate-binding domain-containing protein [Treponema sp.]|nr:substrate-binding domain-containing protein [Treponema sp.]